MKPFNFKLDKVLEYRQMQEQWARDAYLDARTARLEAEFALIEIGQHGKRTKDAPQLQERQQIVVEVLLNEEQKALVHWTEAKIEFELLKKLRDQEYALWQVQANDSLRRELEEWAIWKRAA